MVVVHLSYQLCILFTLLKGRNAKHAIVVAVHLFSMLLVVLWLI